MPAEFATCTPQELRAALAAGQCQALDVREPAEIAARSIPGLRAFPLSEFPRKIETVRRDEPVFLVCQSGGRAALAAARLRALGYDDVRVLRDGLRGWVAAGLPVQTGPSGVWSLERQVRFGAGSLVLAGALLAVVVHPAFVALCGLVGAGLLFAGATDLCGMAMVLARMPWNRRPGPSDQL